jgi:GTP-binding protein HflX
VVDGVLEEIGAGDVPQLHVMNKIDLIQAQARGDDEQIAPDDAVARHRGAGSRGTATEARIARDAQGRPTQVWLSAHTGEGLDLLRQALGELLGGERVQTELQLPLSAGRLHARLRAAGAIAGESVDEHGWHLKIDAPRSVIAPLGGGGGQEAALLRDVLGYSDAP